MAWYLLAYDVTDARRLKRLHRHLIARGTALQRSLFLVQGGREEIARLRAGVEAIIEANEDDVRLFPIAHPSRLWLRGSAATVSPGEEGGPATRLIDRLRGFWNGHE